MFLNESPCCYVDSRSLQPRLLFHLRRVLLPHCIARCTAVQLNQTLSLVTLWEATHLSRKRLLNVYSSGSQPGVLGHLGVLGLSIGGKEKLVC